MCEEREVSSASDPFDGFDKLSTGECEGNERLVKAKELLKQLDDLELSEEELKEITGGGASSNYNLGTHTTHEIP